MERPSIPNYENEKSFTFDYVFELNRYIEFLERKIKIHELKNNKDNLNLPFCGTNERCSEKKKDFFCNSLRKCIHKIHNEK